MEEEGTSDRRTSRSSLFQYTTPRCLLSLLPVIFSNSNRIIRHSFIQKSDLYIPFVATSTSPLPLLNKFRRKCYSNNNNSSSDNDNSSITSHTMFRLPSVSQLRFHLPNSLHLVISTQSFPTPSSPLTCPPPRSTMVVSTILSMFSITVICLNYLQNSERDQVLLLPWVRITAICWT